MALTSGTHVGPYEILSAIVAGGMGEVFLDGPDVSAFSLLALASSGAQMTDGLKTLSTGGL